MARVLGPTLSSRTLPSARSRARLPRPHGRMSPTVNRGGAALATTGTSQAHRARKSHRATSGETAFVKQAHTPQKRLRGRLAARSVFTSVTRPAKTRKAVPMRFLAKLACVPLYRLTLAWLHTLCSKFQSDLPRRSRLHARFVPRAAAAPSVARGVGGPPRSARALGAQGV